MLVILLAYINLNIHFNLANIISRIYPIEINVWRHEIMNGHSSIAHFQFANYSFAAKWGQGRKKHRTIVTWYFTCDNKFIWCTDFWFVYALIQTAMRQKLFCTKVSSKYIYTVSEKKRNLMSLKVFRR